MELAELAVKKALSMKATEAEAYVQHTRVVQVDFADEIENLKTVESTGMGLRVALGKRLAMYSTSILNEGEVDGIAAKAVKIAKVAPEDANWKHMNKKPGAGPAEGYFDKAIENLDYRDIVEALGSAIEAMKEYDKRVKLTRGLLAISTSNTAIANSYSQACKRRETHLQVWMRMKAKDGTLESTGNESQQCRFWKEIQFNELAHKAAEKAAKFLRAKPISGGKMPVVVRNQVFAGMLGVILSGPVNADWVQKGKSPLAGKRGTSIASSEVSVSDDGLMRGGWSTRPFDDEGHATQKTPLLEKGVLKNYIYDTYTALKDDVKSTGNAQRFSYWTIPQPTPNNLLMKSGRATPEDIVSETKNGVFIEETIGEWLSNPVSGNLNATITHGYLIKNGEFKEPIKAVVLSGNFYELLKSGVEVIGSDTRNNGNVYSPTVKLAEVTIAGED